MKIYKSEKEIADAVKKYGSHGKLPSKDVYNGWNAWIKRAEANDGNVWFSVYVQSTETDTDAFVPYRDFVKDGEYVGSAYGIKFRLSESEREEFLKGLSDKIDKLNSTPADALALEKRKKEVSGWRFTNPAEDHLYELMRLGIHSSSADKKPYWEAKESLGRYISENLDEIVRLPDAEIVELYKRVIVDAYRSRK